MPLKSMVRRCQQIVAQDPNFDLIPVNDVHMTLDRVAFEDEIPERTIEAVEHEAAAIARQFPAFRAEVGPLSGSPGALSFSVAPFDPLNQLRLSLTNATASIIEGAVPSEAFRPHVGIAYCNSAVPARPIIDAVHSVRNVPPINVLISRVSLVRLSRLERAYRWSARRRFSLGHEPTGGSVKPV